MTRFQQEITGALGEYWKHSAEKDVADMIADCNESAIVEPDGAIKWIKSDNYLMDDACELLEYGGYPFSRKMTAKKRQRQVEKSIAEYKANYKGPSAEELYEMRAAFGEGEAIVNIFTGESICL